MTDRPTASPLAASADWTRTGPTDAADAAPWELGRSVLEGGGTFWLGTIHPDGRPHLVPVLAVVVDGAVHFCASARSRKARNLAADPRCSIATAGEPMDVVVEGEAVVVDDPAIVRRVATAYAETYGWRPQERDGALWGDGAPTAGPPPYVVHRIELRTAFGFPTDDRASATRWHAD